MKKCVFPIAFLVSLCFVVQPKFAEASSPIEITIRPNHILIGASYNGANISVSGEIPADAEALIRVTGHPENDRLKKKGRALGLLWMNLGAVEFHKVPAVFLLYLPKGVNTSFQLDRQKWQDLGLGLDAVREKAEIVSDYRDTDALFEEFLKLKRKSGLYGTVEDAICYKKKKGGVKSFSCALRLPASLPQGVYKVEAFAIKDGAISGSVVEEIGATEVGIPAFISSLAFKHGTLYGILSVLAAVIVGLLTGVLFRGGKGGH